MISWYETLDPEQIQAFTEEADLQYEPIPNDSELQEQIDRIRAGQEDDDIDDAWDDFQCEIELEQKDK